MKMLSGIKDKQKLKDLKEDPLIFPNLLIRYSSEFNQYNFPIILVVCKSSVGVNLNPMMII